MDDRYEETISEISDKIDDLSDKIDEINDNIEDAIECAVQDAVQDAMSGLNSGGQLPLICVISQDKKSIIPAYSFEARRLKKGEDPYLIFARSTMSGDTKVVGKYDNKQAALSEMNNIAQAVSISLINGPKFYEIK